MIGQQRADPSIRSPHRRAWGLALIPALVGLIVAGTTLVLWRQLRLHDWAQVRRTIESEVDSAKGEIHGHVEPRLFNLVRMAERWQARHSTPRTEWEQDAARLTPIRNSRDETDA